MTRVSSRRKPLGALQKASRSNRARRQECKVVGCTKRPSYGSLRGQPTHCSKHGKTHGMESVINRRCEKCRKHPTFGLEGERARRCADHREDGMENVRHRRCEKCSKSPTFALEGERARRCADHREDGMENVRHRRCEKCSKRPNFAFEGERARRCADHREHGMEDVNSRKCEKCRKRPTFASEGERARRCVDHREDGMEDVINRRCEKCNKQPNFATSLFPRERQSVDFVKQLEDEGKVEDCGVQLYWTRIPDIFDPTITYSGRFDVWVRVPHGLLILFELDGRQHFQPVPYLGSQSPAADFIDRYRRDVAKNAEALRRGAVVIRVCEDRTKIGIPLYELLQTMFEAAVTQTAPTVLESHPEAYRGADALYERIVGTEQ